MTAGDAHRLAGCRLAGPRLAGRRPSESRPSEPRFSEPRLAVLADLDFEIDGRSGHLVADGDRLELVSDDPGRLWAAVADGARTLSGRRMPLRATVGDLGARLDEAGLSVSVTGSSGPVLSVGHGCRSGAGRILLNSPHVRLGSPPALLAAAGGYLRRSPSRVTVRRVTVTGVSLAAAALAAARYRRRHVRG
jgi:hypothetical protein